MVDEVKKIIAQAKSKGCEILLPTDVVTVTEIRSDAERQVVDANKIPAGRMAIDTGPESIKYILDKIKDCKTVVWNGPMGVFEITPFDAGTNALAVAIADKTKQGKCISIAGGGDTVAALENAGVVHDFSYVSTAGGAFLEWLEGRTLPGVAALMKSAKAA